MVMVRQDQLELLHQELSQKQTHIGKGGDGETLFHSNSLAMVSCNNTALDSQYLC